MDIQIVRNKHQTTATNANNIISAFSFQHLPSFQQLILYNPTTTTPSPRFCQHLFNFQQHLFYHLRQHTSNRPTSPRLTNTIPAFYNSSSTVTFSANTFPAFQTHDSTNIFAPAFYTFSPSKLYFFFFFLHNLFMQCRSSSSGPKEHTAYCLTSGMTNMITFKLYPRSKSCFGKSEKKKMRRLLYLKLIRNRSHQ